jgi:hypothetical protein
MPVANYLWDVVEDNIVEEFDDSGSTLADYTTEPELYGSVISQRRDAITSIFHMDAQGSTIAVTIDNQLVTDTRGYTAFGNVTESSGATAFAFQYVGQKGYHKSDVSERYLVRRRIYDPSNARWLSVDSNGIDVPSAPGGASKSTAVQIALAGYTVLADEFSPLSSALPLGVAELGVRRGEVNLYAYVGNRPQSFVDPSGTTAVVLAPGAVLVAIGGVVKVIVNGIAIALVVGVSLYAIWKLGCIAKLLNCLRAANEAALYCGLSWGPNAMLPFSKKAQCAALHMAGFNWVCGREFKLCALSWTSGWIGGSKWYSANFFKATCFPCFPAPPAAIPPIILPVPVGPLVTQPLSSCQ